MSMTGTLFDDGVSVFFIYSFRSYTVNFQLPFFFLIENLDFPSTTYNVYLDQFYYLFLTSEPL